MKALLLKDMTSLNQTTIKEIIDLMTVLKTVEISIFIHSNIDLFMMIISQKILLMKKSISHLL